MTHKTFKDLLIKGRGICVLEVKRDPARYFADLLWACSHELAFDAQCEGSRAWYVYQMICCYPDKSSFLNTLIRNLDNCRSNGGWKLQYLSEILMHFVRDGDREAEAALWRKYDQLYEVLRSKKRLPDRYFAERDDFSMLCVNLGENRNAMVRIAEDIGRLYRENSIYDGWAFDWLYAENGKRYLKTLERKAEKSENIAAYLRESRRTEEEELQEKKNRSPSPVVVGSRLKRAPLEEKLAYMERYLGEKEPEARAQALRPFTRCPYPGDISPVVEDMGSECTRLRLTAGLVLENIRSDQVRHLALDRLAEDPETWFPMLIRNYEDRDADFVTNFVQSMPMDHSSATYWHAVHLDVLKMADHGLKVPCQLLMHIYYSTYCSNCRCKALRQMGRRRMLTDEILEECLYDSQEQVRIYAKRIWNRRRIHK